MNKLFSVFIPVCILLLNACGTAPGASPTGTFIPSAESSKTSTAIPVTPLESAFAPENSTAVPTEVNIVSHEVAFETPDGASITGELYGSGKAAVIFSVMGNCNPGWGELAQLTAAQGLMALTYPWRDCGPSGPVNEEQLVRNFVNDTRGAINFVREQGSDRVILVGASLGGIASAKLAVESGASGLIILAAPPQIPGHDFRIEASDLDTKIPKLFITAENDSTIPAGETRKMYEMAAAPKEWQTYPGTAHGTDLFKSESGPDALERILTFILMIARTS